MMLYAIIALVVLAVLLGLYMLSRVVVVPESLKINFIMWITII